MAAVVVDAVSAKHGGKPVLVDVRLALEPGTLTVLLGPNGAGKSTLLRVVAGLRSPHAGDVQLQGERVADLSRRALARKVAFVPQRHELPAGFTVREVVLMGRAPHQEGWLESSDGDLAIVEEALGFCELTSFSGRRLETLSGGELQRVHLARALAQQAPVLLLDEAASNLDIRHSRACHELVRRLVRDRGLTCLAAMHDLSAASAYADRVALLAEGRILAEGPVERVMTPPLLEQTFGVPVAVQVGPDGRRTFSSS